MRNIVRKALLPFIALCVLCSVFVSGQDRPRSVAQPDNAAKPAAGNAPKISARLIPDSIAIGDHFVLEVTVEKDIMQGLAFPDFENGMLNEAVEILAVSGIDTIAADGRNVTLKVRYLLTTFEDGLLGMGYFPMLYLGKNITDTIFSKDSLFLKVGTFEIDTATMDIYDIKKPIDAPHHPMEYLGYAVGWLALCVVATLVALLVIFRRRKVIGLFAKQRPAEPPHVSAIKALEVLHNQKLWQNNKHKQYYTRITDILRDYLGGRYGVHAMEMTTEEIMDALEGMGIPAKNYTDLENILANADLVKFAKFVPEADYNETAYTNAYYFIEETKEQEAAESKPVSVEEIKLEGEQ